MIINLRDPAAIWSQLAPILDDSMTDLEDYECDLLLLGLFKKMKVEEIAKLLGKEPFLINRQIADGLKKLSKSISRYGLELSPAEITVAIMSNAVQAMPDAAISSVVSGVLKNACKRHKWMRSKCNGATTSR